jgi:hypothetical protein
MKKLLPVLLGLFLVSADAIALPRRSSSTRSSSSTFQKKKIVHVKSYTRKDGTVVKAHERSAPRTSTKKYSASSPGKKPSGSTSTAVGTTTKKYSTSSAVKRLPASGSPSAVQRESNSKIKRSETARSAFMRTHPCPATGKTSGACPGYVVDHVKPLASGGADDPANLQWQTVGAAKEKDKWERK